MLSDKIIKSFYIQYKKSHELLEKEISNKDKSVYIASRILDRIIIFLFIKENMLDEETKVNSIDSILDFYRETSITSKNNGVNIIKSLFPVDRIEEDINISNETIKKIINNFSKYKWSLNENEKNTSNYITPDVLGSVFEKYINQRESGAYYTEEDTIKYIINNTIIWTLIEKLKNKDKVLTLIRTDIRNSEIQDLKYIIKNNIDAVELIEKVIETTNSSEIILDIKDKLDSLTILDPTCGTGAFLVEAAKLLERIYLKLYRKLEQLNIGIKPKDINTTIRIIENNLFGVDIMDDAIDIAKFRLCLRVLQQLNKDEKLYRDNIKFNLKVGNTLSKRIVQEEAVQLVAITLEDEVYEEKTKFNWDVDFEEMIENGGFDCIIGNPPYVEYTKIKDKYEIDSFESKQCKNIYAYSIERSIQLLKKDGVIGFIVPISIVSTPRMKTLRKFVEGNCKNIFYSNFGDRPGTLFNGVHQKISILIAQKGKEDPNIFTSEYYHWYNDERDSIFDNIRYIENMYREEDFYYKIGNEIQLSIINKINKIDTPIKSMICNNSSYYAYWNDRMTFWMKCFKGEKKSNSFKKSMFNSEDESLIFIAVMNSSLYYLFWEIVSDAWHITNKELELFKFNQYKLNEKQRNRLIELAQELEIDLEKNKEYIGSKQVDYEYKHKKSKAIIDKIDEVLKEYYNLSDEEYRYIIDYNLKYRMNDELETYLNERNCKIEENFHMNVIDLFSGAGGFSEGFKKAGFDILVANEIDPMIANTHKENHPETLMINIGIEEFANNVDEIINENLENMEDRDRANYIRENINNIDVIIGGPPCQGFSMAGARNRQANEFIEDPRNYLFRHYFRMIQHFEPNYFIMENVQGLESMKDGQILKEIISLFEDENNFNNGRYYLSRKIVSADELGVPQARKRLIIIGSKFDNINIDQEIKVVKEELNIPEKVTIKDAIGDLNYLESGEGAFEVKYRYNPVSQYQIARRKNAETLYNHIGPKHNDIALDRIKRIQPGQNWRDLEERDEIKSVHSGSYGRLEWDNQSTTITTRFDTPSGGRVIHPERHRALTPREAARIQSFDDSFVFYGNKTSVGKQIGNAVPPLVAEVLANIIRNDIERR